MTRQTSFATFHSQVLIMELGSTHDSIIDVARSGVLLALEHNMLPKPILQEALRCASLQ